MPDPLTYSHNGRVVLVYPDGSRRYADDNTRVVDPPEKKIPVPPKRWHNPY